MSLLLFQADGPVPPSMLSDTLSRKHYLGPTYRGTGWLDDFGCLVLTSPTSRHLPAHWLELSRWCLRGEPNDGSRQWSAVAAWLRRTRRTTTVVSYSDPSVGHTGALYRACNWLWAPTWHRICPPPSGGGTWDGVKIQAPKDRWVFPLAPDPERVRVLRLDAAYLARFPECEYTEPRGANFKAWLCRSVAA